MPFVVVILAIIAVVGGAVFFFRNEANAPVVEVVPITQVATTTEPPSVPTTTPEVPVVATGSTPVATNTTPTTPPSNPPTTQAKPTTPAPTAPTTPTPTPAPVVTAPTPKTLTSKIDYRTPSGAGTSITVTMTLEGTTVTAVDSTYTGNSTDKSYQNRFDGAYKSQVIGQKLGDVSLARVGGASLTSKAFNEAVKQIISQS